MYPDLTTLYASLDIVVFEQDDDRRFKCLTSLLPWLIDLLPQLRFSESTIDLGGDHPFLDLFIQDAEVHWESGHKDVLESGDWVEPLSNGSEIPLTARAVLIHGRRLLTVERIEARYAEIQRVHQAARDTLLAREKSNRRALGQDQHVRTVEEELTMRLLSAANIRDQESSAHLRRIGLYAAAIAEDLGWDEQAVMDIRIAAPMHDIGKLAIPDSILLKPGKLTNGEFRIMQEHSALGASMLAESRIPLLEMACEIALCHHEHWDGSGYPNGLREHEIPLSARIVAVCDVFDALTHERSYKAPFCEEESLSMMGKQRGACFDPEVFDSFLAVLPEIRNISSRLLDDENVQVTDFEQFTGTFG